MAKLFKLLSLALVLAALFVFFSTGSVLADDGGTPTLTEETVSVAPAAEEALPAEEASASLEEETPLEETPAVVEESSPVVEEAPAEAPPVEEVTEEPVVEEPAVEEPVVTEEPVVVVDGEGEPLTLATEETADLLAGGDPYFTVGTTRYEYVFVGQSCSPNTATYTVECDATTPVGTPIFDEVLADIAGGLIPTDKKIYVKAGTYTESILIDGLGNVNHRQLNGLIGVDGDLDLIASDEITINGSVTIRGVNAGFTLSGLTVYNDTGSEDAVTFDRVTGAIVLKDLVVEDTEDTGIRVVDQAGAVTLDEVNSSGNGRRGATINNTRGVYAVTVTGSSFDDNQWAAEGSGLEIISNGAVTVNGVSASRNQGQGAAITTPGVVVVKNGVFADNFAEGLSVLHAGAGAVTLENIIAVANGKPDANSGIWLRTQGPITATLLTARWNGRSGMYITKAGDIYPTTVSISESSFYENNWSGLYLLARGNVTLTNVNANNNQWGDGVYIDNALYYDGTPGDGIDNPTLHGTGTVTLLNTTLATTGFGSNSWNGLVINSAGAVTITGYKAGNNAMDGFYIKNNYPGKTGAVTINALALVDSMMMQSYFNGNGHNGVTIESNGAVSINGNPNWTMRLDRNGNLGLCIACEGGTYLPASVTLKGLDLENNVNGGMNVQSKGAITLNTCGSTTPGATTCSPTATASAWSMSPAQAGSRSPMLASATPAGTASRSIQRGR